MYWVFAPAADDFLSPWALTRKSPTARAARVQPFVNPAEQRPRGPGLLARFSEDHLRTLTAVPHSSGDAVYGGGAV